MRENLIEKKKLLINQLKRVKINQNLIRYILKIKL